jgi:hypothetical protein
VDVALPMLCDAATASGKGAGEGGGVEAAVARLSLADYGGGGVPVSMSMSARGVRYGGQKQDFATSLEPLRSAG